MIDGNKLNGLRGWLILVGIGLYIAISAHFFLSSAWFKSVFGEFLVNFLLKSGNVSKSGDALT